MSGRSLVRLVILTLWHTCIWILGSHVIIRLLHTRNKRYVKFRESKSMFHVAVECLGLQRFFEDRYSLYLPREQIWMPGVFHTDYWFFFAAAVVEVVCLVFILPTYW